MLVARIHVILGFHELFVKYSDQLPHNRDWIKLLTPTTMLAKFYDIPALNANKLLCTSPAERMAAVHLIFGPRLSKIVSEIL